MRRVLASAIMGLAVVGLLAACMPRGEPLTPEQAQVVQANLVQMEAQVTRQLRDSLEARGLHPATSEEVVATLTGNTTSMSGGGGTFVTYYLPRRNDKGPAHDPEGAVPLGRHVDRQRRWHALRHCPRTAEAPRIRPL